MQWINVCFTDYNRLLCQRILCHINMYNSDIVRRSVIEILRFKFDNDRLIRTGASDQKLFWLLCMISIAAQLSQSASGNWKEISIEVCCAM